MTFLPILIFKKKKEMICSRMVENGCDVLIKKGKMIISDFSLSTVLLLKNFARKFWGWTLP